MQTVSFALVIEKAKRLEAYLHSQSISLHPSSILAQSIQKLHQIQSFYENQNIPDGFDTIDATNDAANVWYLADAILGAVGTPFEEVTKPRLTSLVCGNPMPLKNASRSNERDRVFELICARVCSLFASDVKFDEPDILATYKEQRWGVACKSAYGNEKTVVKAIRKGASQINDSCAELGIIAVQLTNIFPHRDMFSVDQETGVITSFNNQNDQIALFGSLIENIVTNIENEGAKHYKKCPIDFTNRIRGVLYVAQTACVFRERTTIMGGCKLTSRGDLREEYAFCEEFNNRLQSILTT